MTYATAHEVITSGAHYIVHIHTDMGWTTPPDPDYRQVLGLDALLAARRVLRTEPAGTAWSTPAKALHLQSNDGRLCLRFTPTTATETNPRPHLYNSEPAPGSTLATPAPPTHDDDRCPQGGEEAREPTARRSLSQAATRSRRSRWS